MTIIGSQKGSAQLFGTKRAHSPLQLPSIGVYWGGLRDEIDHFHRFHAHIVQQTRRDT